MPGSRRKDALTGKRAARFLDEAMTATGLSLAGLAEQIGRSGSSLAHAHSGRRGLDPMVQREITRAVTVVQAQQLVDAGTVHNYCGDYNGESVAAWLDHLGSCATCLSMEFMSGP